MTDGHLRIPGTASSLRDASYNRGLLGAAREDAAEAVEICAFELKPIPLFSEDVEAQGDPPSLQHLKEQIRPADALLIATPEYNNSIPGVRKNAIDWASRAPQDSPVSLRQAFFLTKSSVQLEPELHVSDAHAKFDTGVDD
jgi:chromate reductase, NAD(P)H dehydrogenase (quinone)